MRSLLSYNGMQGYLDSSSSTFTHELGLLIATVPAKTEMFL